MRSECAEISIGRSRGGGTPVHSIVGCAEELGAQHVRDLGDLTRASDAVHITHGKVHLARPVSHITHSNLSVRTRGEPRENKHTDEHTQTRVHEHTQTSTHRREHTSTHRR
eukprot:1717081-Pyramimonas_sp.AAC.1